MKSRMRTWQLNQQARLRRAPHGGAAFLPETVTTIELDAEAFAALALLATPQTARALRPRLSEQFRRNFTLAEIDVLLCDLAAQGFLTEACGDDAKRATPSSVIHHLSWPIPAPESVHLQLNNVCNLRCPSCYVGLQDTDAGSLPLTRIYELIDEWAEMGVFQLALGGGEPLLSPKFAPVVRYARARGMVPNATTNGWLISEELLDEGASQLGELRISLNDTVAINHELLAEKAALLQARGLRFGFNLIVTRQNLDRLPELLRWACEQGAATINLIRPKPAPGNESWYAHNALTNVETARLAALLITLEPLFTHTALAIDCAFSFLFHSMPTAELQARGVAGCAMGERFVTIKWDGDVYPCSHLHGAEFKAGNVWQTSFRKVWEESASLASLRREIEEVDGHCGSCSHKAFCKGCRAVMQEQTGNWLAADRDCALTASL